MTNPFVIVGAGIAGASLAFALARGGRDVLVIDDNRAGRATAWNPGGINPLHGPGFPGSMAPVYRRAYELHREWHPQVQGLSGIDFGARTVDRLFLAASDEEMRTLQALTPHYAALAGFSARWLKPAAFAGTEARLAPDWRGGLLTAGNMRLDSERYRLALLAAACRVGAHVANGRVERVDSVGDAIVSVTWDGGRSALDGLCMATGAWEGPAIAGWMPGTSVAVSALIGDLLLVEGTGAPLKLDVSHGLTAIYQHQDNQYWIGGTERKDGPRGPGTDAARDALLAGAARLVPSVAQWRVIGQGSAARPVTSDRRPIVGRAPAYQNGWIINGGGGKGILMSSWMASTLAGMIASDAVPEDAVPFLPTRATG